MAQNEHLTVDVRVTGMKVFGRLLQAVGDLVEELMEQDEQGLTDKEKELIDATIELVPETPPEDRFPPMPDVIDICNTLDLIRQHKEDTGETIKIVVVGPQEAPTQRWTNVDLKNGIGHCYVGDGSNDVVQIIGEFKAEWKVVG